MNIFQLRDRLIGDYSTYTQSFIRIHDERIHAYVQEKLLQGLLWPEPLIQLNPSFEPGAWIDELVAEDVLHEQCRRIFRIKPEPGSEGKPLRLHRHQEDAVRLAREGVDYVLTTGTGSGKSLSYIVPIVDSVLREGSGKGIRAIIVYPMNALANSQLGELEKFLRYGYGKGESPVTFSRYTGQETPEQREGILANPADILLTNFVMLEYILTRPRERSTLVKAAQGLRFLVLDELHTYRGRQGADVAMLVRRVRDALRADSLQCVGTSATLAGGVIFAEQQQEVAQVASRLFGSQVKPEHIIGETLRRATPDYEPSDAPFVEELKAWLAAKGATGTVSFEGFIQNPLARWIETTFGIQRESDSGRLVRNRPRTITGERGAAQELAELTGAPRNRCVQAIQQALLNGYQVKHPETGFPIFAFRLHQFISRGDTVYASLEEASRRHLTVHGQQYVPGDRSRLLFPLAFCRECGHEYYLVSASKGSPGERIYLARERSNRFADGEAECGYIYLSSSHPWRDEEVAERVPDDWLEEHQGAVRIRKNRRDYLPRRLKLNPEGREEAQGIECHYIAAPLRFCLNCGVSYGFRQSSDFAKLAQLGSEGRSTATTILSLSTVLGLRETEGLAPKARKLLSFTDNRQDASLQAGHFNDFIEVGLLRAALYKAVQEAENEGLRHDELTQKVFNALGLPVELYAADPEVRFQARIDTDRTFRDVLGYRLYRDLRRGWRIIAPNLEQCGLLEIRYASLHEACAAEDLWVGSHRALIGASPATRSRIAKVLLDSLRRQLAIKVDYLDTHFQERLQQRSNQRLREPWAIDENERMEHATVVFPRPGSRDDYRGHVYLSARGGFGQYLRRRYTFEDYTDRISLDDTQEIIGQLLEALRKAGLVEAVQQEEGTSGYQVPAACMLWLAGDGTRAFHDPITVPSPPEGGGRTNPFFVDFYRTVAMGTKGLEAREHTAQVPYEQRQRREQTFREARLPILYCSPTMELGIDIAELNAVNLRNVPPTPANYAQRSGRAGRSGQPALVFTYCSTGNAHDQYFFKRPERMVAGAVTSPRLDLGNEDLIKAHMHAIWLAEAGLELGSSLTEILEVNGEEPSLALLPSIKDVVTADTPRQRARLQAERVLGTLREELEITDWYGEHWLEGVFQQIPLSFEQACERWRGLFRAAREQFLLQNRIISDASRSAKEKNRAKRVRREAEAQLELLTESRDLVQSDFYSYRYFASEGFLPGYNFPRLPLSAYIPGSRGTDEFISRPRFLAISEFGPRSIIYHEGARFIINRVIMPPRDEDGILTERAKQCGACGYLHPIDGDHGPDLCERCEAPLSQPLTALFRLQNVSTKRRDRISSDEEERQRLGYEIRSGVRFADYGGGPSYRSATVRHEGEELMTLTYGQAAELWRINLGWRRRSNPDQRGFVLDTERGYWARNDQLPDEDDPGDELGPVADRVIPYVKDRRNCLLVEPAVPMDEAAMAGLQAALKTAIQVLYQLEDSELAAEPLPSRDERRLILLFESAEGGAGVLRRLLDDVGAMGRVARQVLELCHFNPKTGEDLRRAPGMEEDCEAACYHCLMSYGNQMDHPLLDRQVIKGPLLRLRDAEVVSSPTPASRSEHLEALLARCDSELERRWLRFLESRKLRLPSASQVFTDACKTRPDFVYQDELALIYVDGPPHDYPDRQYRDRQRTECLEDQGYQVIRFGHEDDWAAIVAAYPNLFGVTA